MSTTTFSLRVDNELLERIDRAAAQAGENRTEYILRWLPVTYDRATEQDAEQAEQPQR